MHRSSRVTTARVWAARPLGGIVVLLAVAACATTQTRALTEGDQTLLVQTVSDSGADAALVGDLGVNDRGCLGLVGADGTVTTAIWPQGFDLVSEGRVRTARGTVLEIGASISGGGGRTHFEAAYPALADLCLPDGIDPDDEAAEVIVLASVDP
ncbi:hypothetical protein [Actinotalea sp. C106]|uniref:hypothetical protein n=1 Tax=Actinotalea sp. C106 TaxID=2908644 RepID=UPI0020298867|nr:hypothetical protein [Actinotalea sp. C106]